MKSNKTVIYSLLALLILGLWAIERMMSSHLRTEIEALQQTLAQTAEETPYLVIDTTNNQLHIRERETIIHEAICATGSGKVLLGSGRRSWAFRTPQGLYRIQGKFANPIWTKPAWAFIEEGQPIPPISNIEARYDSTALGDYAMALGDGYFIHGTLYTSFLGESVTHGCIRLDDDDLKQVYLKVRQGTRVYIY